LVLVFLLVVRLYGCNTTTNKLTTQLFLRRYARPCSIHHLNNPQAAWDRAPTTNQHPQNGSTECPHQIHIQSTNYHTKTQHLINNNIIKPPYLIILTLTNKSHHPTLITLTDTSTNTDSK